MRDAITAAIKDAMKAGDKDRLSTLRMMNAAIKDRDIEARGAGKGPLEEDDLLQLFQKMVKQRQESAKIYAENGRDELAAQENAEIGVIKGFMPQQMDEAGMVAAVDAVVTELGAAGMKDMGRVMAALKERHTGSMDFGKANGLVKQRLS
jgi:uncharacterized protein YqeY